MLQFDIKITNILIVITAKNLLIYELEGEVVFFVDDTFAVCGDIIEVSKAKFDEVLILNFSLTGVCRKKKQV